MWRRCDVPPSQWVLLVHRQKLRRPIGTAIAFSSAILNFVRAVLSVVTSLSKITQNSSKITFLRGFLANPTVEGEQSEAAVGREIGDIEFRDVWFSYRGNDTYVLRNVSFCIRQGERIALVGRNGSGKSTLVRLLLELHDPSAGQILVNGTLLSGSRAIAHRTAVTVVFQDFCRYHLRVRDNVELSSMRAAGDDVALRRAIAHGGRGVRDTSTRRCGTTVGNRVWWSGSLRRPVAGLGDRACLLPGCGGCSDHG